MKSNSAVNEINTVNGAHSKDVAFEEMETHAIKCFDDYI